MNKQYPTLPVPDIAAADDMALINRWTRKTLAPEEVYTFCVVLCDNEIDRDYERFSVAALEELAVLFVGKTGIFDHRASAKEQTARIYAAAVERDPTRTTSAGEPYTFLKAKAYMPRTAKYEDLIADIDAGIKKEVSVGCRVRSKTCSVCAADTRGAPCAHRQGTRYDGALCHTVLGEATDAYEWSFVAVPAQPGAGVTKAYKRKETTRMESIKDMVEKACDGQLPEDAQALLARVDTLEKQAADGRAYREELTDETLRLGLMALPHIPADCLGGICGRLSVGELRELKQAFMARAGAKAAAEPQLRADRERPSADNTQFRI